MTSTPIEIPDMGDAEDVEVIEICVAVGDRVDKDDALIVVESEKASMEVPSPLTGTVVALLAKLGDLVNAGDHIADIDAVESKPTEEFKSTDSRPEQPEILSDVVEETPVLDVPTSEESTTHISEENSTEGSSRDDSIYAGPAVRKLARELGVDLSRINGTGTKGRIVKDDLTAFVKHALQDSTAAGGMGIPAIELPDFSKWGLTEKIPLTRMRVRGAENLSKSWLNLVHVTQHDEADVTKLEQFRQELNSQASSREDRLTPLPFILKACVNTMKEFPQFNASIDPTENALIYKKYYHFGMAVDTADGLIVPVIRDVDKKSIREISKEAKELAIAAQSKGLKPDQLQGASFTVTSLGNIGGTGFTPIINAPEVAILGVARMSTRPVWDKGEFVPRRVLPLSLSYDHRAINGAESGRFMSALIERLQDIRLLAL